MAGLEVITGDLRAVAQLEPGTFQHWDKLSRDQIRDASLQDRCFYVADFPLYTAAGGKSMLGLARHTVEHPNNLVLAHLFDQKNSSFDRLIYRNFLPDPDEARAVLEAADTLKVELSGLHLCGDDNFSCFLSIRTKDGFIRAGGKYQRPNELEQAVLHRGGYTSDFLNVLHSAPYRRNETRLYVLNPDYISRIIGEGFVGHVAWRDNFANSANSYTFDNNVLIQRDLRGVRRVVAAKGNAPKNKFHRK